MDAEDVLAELERLAKRMGVTVRYEATEGRAGRCLLRGEPVALIETRLPVAAKVQALATVLADLDHERYFVPESVRDLLERCRDR